MSRSITTDSQRRWRVLFVALFLAALAAGCVGAVYWAVTSRAHTEAPR
ncbi:hypothetical protein [Longispora fulva]|uniref:Uncharacterized membrane protein YsdA (DUF1294 family) n=1 Tax=Longispora fulva TaxID=619741 RepID=A0A8J7GSL4_9ACTN|nr:hypothetical protein [Longispora fulva]MBG6136291.1 uncharacterized membrane protein YsdA (DUF1294 family) [Longispora fulva]